MFTSSIYGVRSGTKSILRFRGLRNTSSLRKLFFESLSVVFVASVPCLRVVTSLVSSYCFLRVIVCCLRGVGSMSSSRHIPRFIVLFSSSHCLLSSWRRFHVFESSHPSFHRTVFFESLSVVFVASVPCLRVVASLVSSYCCLRGVGSMSSSRRIPRFIVLLSSSHVCCLRGVGSMSSSRRIPRFIVPYSLGHCCFYVFVSSALPFVDCATNLRES